MNCATVTLVLFLGLTAVGVVTIMSLSEANAIPDAVIPTQWYSRFAGTYLTPDPAVAYGVWALIVGAAAVSITVFTNPHASVGRMPARIGLLRTLVHIALGVWILVSAYVGGGFPDLGWLTFLLAFLIWGLDLFTVIWADLGSQWKDTFFGWCSRYCCRSDAEFKKLEKDEDIELRNLKKKQVAEAKRAANPRRASVEGGERVEDFVYYGTDLNSARTREVYPSGAKAVHFFFIEFPVALEFGFFSAMMLVIIAQAIDQGEGAGTVDFGWSIFIQILIAVLALLAILLKNLHAYALGTLWVMGNQYARQMDFSDQGLAITNLVGGIILLLGVVIVTIVRIYHAVRTWD